MAKRLETAPRRRPAADLRRTLGLAALLCASGITRRVAALDGPAPGAAAAQSIKTPDGPASVRGLADPATADVFTGQVGYRVPIDLPVGPGGFGPELGLRYGGELGN